METCLKELGKMIEEKVLASIDGTMVINTRDNG
jgi:hypothetical protein